MYEMKQHILMMSFYTSQKKKVYVNCSNISQKNPPFPKVYWDFHDKKVGFEKIFMILLKNSRFENGY